MRRLRIWASLSFATAALAGMAGFLVFREMQPHPVVLPPELSVNEYVEALADPSVAVRREAAAALENLGPRAAGALLPLLGALSDDDMLVRTHAIVALGRLGTVSYRPLTDALQSSANVLVRRGAAGALALQMPDAAAAAPLLISALDDPDEGVRANAGRGLAALGTTAVYGANQRTTTEL